MRRLAFFRFRTAWTAAIFLCFLSGLAWPWAKTLPQKWFPLDDYLVYDAQGRKLQMVGGSPSSWHTPNSRFELLSTPDHLIQFPKSPVSKPRAKPARPAAPPSKRMLKVLDDDLLNDFVIDKGNHYASPETRRN